MRPCLKPGCNRGLGCRCGSVHACTRRLRTDAVCRTDGGRNTWSSWAPSRLALNLASVSPPPGPGAAASVRFTPPGGKPFPCCLPPPPPRPPWAPGLGPAGSRGLHAHLGQHLAPWGDRRRCGTDAGKRRTRTVGEKEQGQGGSQERSVTTESNSHSWTHRSRTPGK